MTKYYWSNVDYHSASGLYYKMGRDQDGNAHLLCSGDRGSLERNTTIVHDHYWKRNGRWYVQVKNNNLDKSHILDKDTPFDAVQPGVDRMLDEVLKKLGG